MIDKLESARTDKTVDQRFDSFNWMIEVGASEPNDGDDGFVSIKNQATSGKSEP